MLNYKFTIDRTLSGNVQKRPANGYAYLVPWVPGSELPRIWRLVDQHCVHSSDVGASEVLNIV